MKMPRVYGHNLLFGVDELCREGNYVVVWVPTTCRGQWTAQVETRDAFLGYVEAPSPDVLLGAIQDRLARATA